jgi:hypothetical protein
MNRKQRRELAKRKMYQCHVISRSEDGKERQLAIGPRFDNEDAPMSLCAEINKSVALGKEKRWREARVIEVNDMR